MSIAPGSPVCLRMQTKWLVQPADFVAALDLINYGIVDPFISKEGHTVEGHLIAHVLDMLGSLVGDGDGGVGEIRIKKITNHYVLVVSPFAGDILVQYLLCVGYNP